MGSGNKNRHTWLAACAPVACLGLFALINVTTLLTVVLL